MQVDSAAAGAARITSGRVAALLAAKAPELLGLVTELRERVGELKARVAPLRALLKQVGAAHSKPLLGVWEGGAPQLPLPCCVSTPQAAAAADEDADDIVAYLKVKQQMLLAYCVSLTFYLYMKVPEIPFNANACPTFLIRPPPYLYAHSQVQGESVRDHPVMRRLLELRYVMEKMRALDGKMKHQIDRLMKQSSGAPTALRPNIANLVPRDGGDDDDDDDEDDDEEEDDEDGGGRRGRGAKVGTGLYKAPKMAATPYHDNEARTAREAQRLQRRKKKLSNSEIMETLREEFGTAPEAASSSGLSKASVDQRRMEEEADERRSFEEERFVRLVRGRVVSVSTPMRTCLFAFVPVLTLASARRRCPGKRSSPSRSALWKLPAWTTSTTLVTWPTWTKLWNFRSEERVTGGAAAVARRPQRWRLWRCPPGAAVREPTRPPGRCSAR